MMRDGITKTRDFIRILLAVALALMSAAGIGGMAIAASTGSINGCVQSDNGTPLGGAHVVAYNWETGVCAGEAYTSQDGTYTIGRLTLPRYRVKADAEGYFPEYYREGGSIPVVVFAPYPATKIDFTLTPGSYISGYVYQADGLTPIDAARVVAYQEAAGAWEYTADGYTDSEGLYSITTGAGTYRVRAEAAGYAAKYYLAVSDSAGVAEIDVTANGYVTNIDFSLNRIGFVSGTTYKADGITPIAGVHVVAYDSTTGTSVEEGFSGANAGAYYINLSPGTYRLKAEAPGFAAEWYAGATTSDAATPVSVGGLDETPDLNFNLSTALGVTTLRARDVTTESARLIGDLTSLGSANEVTVSFLWRTVTGSYSHETPKQVRNTKGYFSYSLTGLTPGTTYYYKSKAVGETDAIYGEEKGFTTTDNTAPVISMVSCNTTAFIAIIAWNTDEVADSRIDFGLTADYSQSTGVNPEMVTSHRVWLCDLKANTMYHYRIISTDASGNKTISQDFAFTTEEYYNGMATQTWKAIGWALVAAVGVALCFLWAKTKQ